MMAALSTTPQPRLSALLADTLAVPAELDCDVDGLAMDSRVAGAGEIFFARRGTRHDGARFAKDARARGVVAVVMVGAPGAALRDGVVEIGVADVDACLGRAAARLHGRIVDSLRLVGVTGTNGKTSVSHFAACALDSAAGGCGVIGTLGHGRSGQLSEAGLTTPDALTTHRALAELHAGGCARAVLEVSSHALDQNRLAGLRFATAAYTNLSRDHLDYHGEMAAYAGAKARLFSTPGLQSAVINRDDAFGRELSDALDPGVSLITYGTGPAPASRGMHLTGHAISLSAGGLEVDVEGPWGRAPLRARLAGRFNAANLLAALGIALAEGLDPSLAFERLRAVRAVPGRMEPFGGHDGSPLIVVDYAHTPDALAQALGSLRGQCRGRLWCVFGCGGERDPGKRTVMGSEAARLADALVLTDDNPRGEDGDEIIEQVLDGIPPGTPVTVERDRGAAIRTAVAAAGAGDAVLVAGKGHETYQEIAGVRRPFSDAASVRAALGAGDR